MGLHSDIRRARRAMETSPTQGVLACLGILGRFPGNAQAQHLLRAMSPVQRGAVLADAGRLCGAAAWAEALALLAPLSLADPTRPDVAQAEAQCLFNLGRFADMAARASRALAAHPAHPGLLASQGTALYRLGRADEALALLDRAARGAPDDPHIANTLGLLRRSLGDLAGAERAFRAAVAVRGGLPEAWPNLATLVDFATEPALAAQLDAAEAATTVQAEVLGFARAKAAFDRGDHAGAFRTLEAANALHRAAHPHDAAGEGAVVRALARRLPDVASGATGDRPRPILVVGMPRSGTTLVERILDRHLDVAGLGECDDLRALVTGIDQGTPWTAAQRDALGATYRAALAARADRPVAVDKMPSNALVAGFALAAMPDAQVVHVRRDPVATALSNWRTRYTEGNAFAYALPDIIARQALTDEMMALWAARFPGRVHTLVHEALTEAPARQIAALCRALGLTPDPACVAFTGGRGDIRTASAHQVRAPVTPQDSSDWSALEPYLGSLPEDLAEARRDHAAALDAARQQ